MNKVVIASIRRNSGKTSLIVGLAHVMGKKFAYLKPFGDRLYYRKKRLWDYDSALMANLFSLKENPEDMSIGFEHTKVRYMYNDETIKQKLAEMISDIQGDNDILLIEASEHLTYGASVNLDAISLARNTGSRLIFVLSGDEGAVMDDLSFLKKCVCMEGVDFAGVIINKVQDVEDFKETHLDCIKDMGIPVLGIIPFEVELTYLSVNNIVERLFVKVMGGESGLNRTIKNVIIGAMNADVAMKEPVFKKEGKLVITAGDRSDMIVAALESNTSGIVITNDIVPSSTIIAKASEYNIPLLLVSEDTYQVARQIDSIEPILTKGDAKKIEIVKKMVKENLDLNVLFPE
ncbi:MAG: AAA family ATPase [Deltaproteobacteria bacterium]|nr:AAA family ATPase [Deltaproteobacteria bacterium]